MKTFQKDKLTVRIFDTRREMGAVAAGEIRDRMLTLLQTRETLNMIFAAAPSQNEVLEALVADPSIPWNRVNAFHMDEYIGLPADAPQRFGTFLARSIFDRVPMKRVFYIDCSADVDSECDRYSALLREYPVDIVVLGIGENGHIAFNDPPVADFNDPALVKAVTLDEVCRNQQVHDGCFPTLDAVPRQALTLTVPALFAGAYLFCIVPAPTKAKAVRDTVLGPVGEHCPATVLRLHENAGLYLDRDSAALLEEIL